MGDRMLKRLQDSVVLNGVQKAHVLRKLKLVLYLIIFCIITEVVGRIILSMPGWVGETKWEEKPQPWYDMRHFLENQSLVWQFVGYILPYDMVCFCLLYLMRAPMKQQAVFSANVDESEDERSSRNSRPHGHSSDSSRRSSNLSGSKSSLSQSQMPLVREDGESHSSNSMNHPLAGESGSSSIYHASNSLFNPLLSGEDGGDGDDRNDDNEEEDRSYGNDDGFGSRNGSYAALTPQAPITTSYCADVDPEVEIEVEVEPKTQGEEQLEQ
jgi:hypothetical protein